MPFAIAGILVVSSVAFGATFVRSIVRASPSATPVVVGDENPTDSPSLAPSQAPSAAPSEAPSEAPTAAPASGDLTLTAGALPGKVQLTWTKYAGADFAYYKVVRSTYATASWPLGEGDTLVAAIDNVGTLAYLDPLRLRPQPTLKPRSQSPLRRRKSTPKPTPAGPANLGQLKITDNGDGTYMFQ